MKNRVGFKKKTIADIKLKGKRVLLRADFNVPQKNGQISDDFRLRAALPTIEYILKNEPKLLVIISHLGRPTSPKDQQFSLAAVAARLGKLLDKKVIFVPDCIGQPTAEAVSAAPEGSVLLLENLRFHGGEEKNDPDFAKALVQATSAQVFVQDGFGVVHRAHASTLAITELLPSVAGLLLAKEVETIERVMSDPARPLTAIVGGAKISDKLDVLNRFIELADCVAVGGALANNFLHTEKFSLGQSLTEPESYDEAHEILVKARQAEKERPFKFLVPVDVVVSRSPDGRSATRVVDLASHSLADIESYPAKPKHPSFSVAADEKILDIGPVSAGLIAGAVGISQTVVWAGTLGVTETLGLAGAEAPFAHASNIVAEAIIGASNQHAHKPFSVVGGGDTVSYIQQQGWAEDFSHVSTGGSASLELMAGHKLPGVEALENK